ncbi:hypothetical protein [Natronorubrum texcoconense]|uniref:Uncharacterized protein n=1 Tax=Natronorubrum texcoconense TaxID=1095776 RepID=A0A1G9CUE6_9EURY|nr:hypothetical protein [Natronorubrum texcoconense]SDK55249.1 hypothetical protein SAMN04515672_3312 [Natronorubrum texcoconense]
MANRPPARASSFSSQLWIWMLAFSTALLLLLGWSFLHLEPGTPSYVIGQVSAIVLSLTILGTLVALLSDWEPF